MQIVKQPSNKFLRKYITDKTYVSHLFEKVLSTKDNALTAYHSYLEQTLNTVVVHSKIPEELLPRPRQVWISKSKTATELLQKREIDLVSQITPVCSPDQTLGSGLYSPKLLADLAAVRPLPLLVPETLVNGYGFDSPTLMYTDSRGLMQTIGGIHPGQFEILGQVFSSHRTINETIIAPLAVVKSPNSLYNKIIMRNSELKLDWKNLIKSDAVCQRYILTKGNMCSKLRLIFKNDKVRVFKITNKNRFDRSSYQETNESTLKMKLIANLVNSQISALKAKRQNSSFSTDIMRKVSGFVGDLSNLPEIKEIKYETLTEFMDSIKDLPKKDISGLYAELVKTGERRVIDSEGITEDVINNKILSKLRSIFCTDSKNPNASTIIELKSEKSTENVIRIFNWFRETINSSILQFQQLKLSELMCDFAEDCNKNIYFLQLKYFNCVSNAYIPLKQIKKRNLSKFTCPGEYCDNKSSMNNTEMYAQSVLVPIKKVLPKKCKVLRGTILGEKLNPNNSLQQLHPRLFERVQVCPNCFLVYNDWSDKNMQNLLAQSDNHFLDDEDEIFPISDSVNKIKIRREPNYMGELGASLHKFSRAKLNKTYQHKYEKPAIRKEPSIFQYKKKSIDNAIHLEEFMHNQNNYMF